MNILFLTIGDFDNLEAGSVHVDLVKKFASMGHHVYVACKNERPACDKMTLESISGISLLRIRTGAIKKNTNFFRKGLSTITLERKYIKAIKSYYQDVKFDLVLYHTPPITFQKVVSYIKKRDGAVSYLLLKDIFPQNAVDLGLMSKTGLRGFIYRYFRKKEIALYKTSDFIGCMSPANVAYLKAHNPYYQGWRVEVAPNSIELRSKNLALEPCSLATERTQELRDKESIRGKYGLPADKPVFIYGGNLGKPQGIDFLIKCLDENKYRKDCFFVVVGSGSEYPKLETWLEEQKKKDDRKTLSVKLMQGLPKKDYDQLVGACDVGLIFLDHRFTIPNYPSRLLSYLENKMPVICATDVHTDIGSIAEVNGYGFWCESVNPINFTVLVDRLLVEPGRIKTMGERGYEYLKKNYLVDHTYQAVMRHFNI